MALLLGYEALKRAHEEGCGFTCTELWPDAGYITSDVESAWDGRVVLPESFREKLREHIWFLTPLPSWLEEHLCLPPGTIGR